MKLRPPFTVCFLFPNLVVVFMAVFNNLKPLGPSLVVLREIPNAAQPAEGWGHLFERVKNKTTELTAKGSLKRGIPQ